MALSRRVDFDAASIGSHASSQDTGDSLKDSASVADLMPGLSDATLKDTPAINTQTTPTDGQITPTILRATPDASPRPSVERYHHSPPPLPTEESGEEENYPLAQVGQACLEQGSTTGEASHLVNEGDQSESSRPDNVMPEPDEVIDGQSAVSGEGGISQREGGEGEEGGGEIEASDDQALAEVFATKGSVGWTGSKVKVHEPEANYDVELPADDKMAALLEAIASSLARIQ